MGAGLLATKALKTREDLASLLMAWYYAGYYTGQWAQQGAGGQGGNGENAEDAAVGADDGTGA